jgi:hypothetical protein
MAWPISRPERGQGARMAKAMAAMTAAASEKRRNRNHSGSAWRAENPATIQPVDQARTKRRGTARTASDMMISARGARTVEGDR